MNERDSELVAHDLVQNGYELVNNESGADIVLLNTSKTISAPDSLFTNS